jgi:hypothetical protein
MSQFTVGVQHHDDPRVGLQNLAPRPIRRAKQHLSPIRVGFQYWPQLGGQGQGDVPMDHVKQMAG